jgi:hypothetical protein
MKTIFKQGDRVFDYQFGWGQVVRIFYEGDYAVVVQFKHLNEEHSYTECGKYYKKSCPTLSFTEYSLNGFSQERPESIPEKGDVVWVRDYESQQWLCRYYLIKDNKGHLVTAGSPHDMTNGRYYHLLTTQNPYKK